MKILKFKKIYLSISFLLVFVSIILFFTIGLRLSIDFTGGTYINFSTTTDTNITEIADYITEFQNTINTKVENNAFSDEEKELGEITTKIDLGEPLVVSSNTDFIIRMQYIDEATHNHLSKFLITKFDNFQENKYMTISATISQNLKERAIYALIIAIIGIILFIAYSFRKVPKKISPFKFGFCAVIALFHDVMITILVFIFLGHFLGVEVGSFFVTALLTILGYSVNDTIVVFDRIRENLIYQSKGESFADVAEKSLKQTLTRSINTSLTTLITLSALFFLGSESIKWFVLALIVGVLSGTYSSIFIATPILALWKNKK